MNILRQIKQGKRFFSFIGLKTISEVISFSLPLIIAKVLTPELFGSFSLFKMLLFFGTAIFIGPLLTPLSIESNKEYTQTKKSNKTFTSSLVVLLGSILIFALIFIFWGREMIVFTGLNYQEYRLVFIMAFVGLVIKSFLSALFMGQDNKRAHIFVELFYNIILIVYVLGIYKIGVFDLYNIFVGFFIAALITLFISLDFINYKNIFPLSFSLDNFKTLTHFSLWIVLGSVSVYFINWGDNLVLRYFVTMEDVGIYNFAYQIFKGFIIISLMINTYFTPFVARNLQYVDKLDKYYFNYRPKIIIFSIIVLLIVNVLISLLIRFFYLDYLNAIIPIHVLSVGALCSLYYSFIMPFYNSAKFYKVTQLFWLVQVLINLFLDIVFVYFWGILGVAVATTISYLLFTWGFTAYFNKKIRPRYLSH